MNERIQGLKKQLQYKEQELRLAKSTAARKNQEYQMVKHIPSLNWYGKGDLRIANNNCDRLQREIEYLKQEIARAEEKAL